MTFAGVIDVMKKWLIEVCFHQPFLSIIPDYGPGLALADARRVSGFVNLDNNIIFAGMKRIVIASDSFKGSLGSAEVAEAAAAGVHDVFPECEAVQIQVADGGEGMLAAIRTAMKPRDVEEDGRFAETVTLEVHDPLGRKVKAEYLIYNGIAIIETAQASGLTLLSGNERNPLKASTYGTGELILDAFSKGCRRFMIGLGGSATNDGGTGMLEALGFRFYDRHGSPITGCCGEKLKEIHTIDGKQVDNELLTSYFEVACDVDTPFCGPEGAARVFARQKGADDAMIEELEAGMQSWAEVIGHSGLMTTPGSGAAGGLGGALAAFMNARLRKGIDIILDTIGFDDIIKGADMVITGEGRIDSQTFKGKAPYGILERAQKQGIPTIAVCGLLEPNTAHNFQAVLPIQPRPQNGSELRSAMNPTNTTANIRKTVSDFLSRNQSSKI